MKKPSFLQPPAWFSVRSPQQEDVIDSAMKGAEDAEAIQRRGFDEARAKALPYMAEVVRELDARTAATVRGGIRTWSPESYERVMRNRNGFLKNVRNRIFTFFHSKNAKYS